MCNLYSELQGQAAIRRLFDVPDALDFTGNLPPLPAIFPDKMAPIVRVGDDGQRRLEMRRWGLPSPPAFLKGPIDPGITNIRNTDSAHWRPWLGPANRCLVPATSFCEPSDQRGPDGRKIWTWFALNQERPPFAFAGIWCDWNGLRGTKSKPDEGLHNLFAFLTTAPNEIVKPIHAKAMPVVLTTPEEFDVWLRAPANIALQLQRPLPPALLQVVAQGATEDHGALGGPQPSGMLL
jgi:putative SOS response-associated peptidase YedK